MSSEIEKVACEIDELCKIFYSLYGDLIEQEKKLDPTYEERIKQVIQELRRFNKASKGIMQSWRFSKEQFDHGRETDATDRKQRRLMEEMAELKDEVFLFVNSELKTFVQQINTSLKALSVPTPLLSVTHELEFDTSVKNKGKVETVATSVDEFLEKLDEFRIKVILDDTELFNRLGGYHFKNKRFDKAQKYFEKALEINPKLGYAWNNLGVIHGKLGDYKKAKKCLNIALKINPKDPFTFHNLGRLYHNFGNREKAIEYYKKALEINPKYAKTWYNLGVAYHISSNDPETDFENKFEAQKCYKKALDINPEMSYAWGRLGLTHYDLSNWLEAINCYNKALEIDPEDAGVWSSLGVIYYKLENYEEAKRCYKKALKINPEDAITWTNLGVLHEKLGDKEKAKQCYKKARQLR